MVVEGTSNGASRGPSSVEVVRSAASKNWGRDHAQVNAGDALRREASQQAFNGNESEFATGCSASTRSRVVWQHAGQSPEGCSEKGEAASSAMGRPGGRGSQREAAVE